MTSKTNLADETQEVTPAVFSAHLAAELDRHRGKWVAVLEDRVVAVADSAEAVVAAARAQQITDPLVFRVSTDPDQLNYL